MKLSEDSAIDLAEAIISRTAQDYINHYIKGEWNKLKELEYFFNSHWFEELTFGKADVDTVIKSLKIQGNYAKLRKEHGCGKCRKGHCIHNLGTHWTSITKGEFECLKKK